MIHCSSFYFAVYFSAICVFRFGYNSYWFILFNHLIVVVLGDASFTRGAFFLGKGAIFPRKFCMGVPTHAKFTGVPKFTMTPDLQVHIWRLMLS